MRCFSEELSADSRPQKAPVFPVGMMDKEGVKFPSERGFSLSPSSLKERVVDDLFVRRHPASVSRAFFQHIRCRV